MDDLCELADPVVLLGRADVERLARNQLVGCVEERDRRATDVSHVDERTPRRAVALQTDRSGRVRPRDKVVEHDVQTQARRDTVDGRVAHGDGGEPVSGEPAQRLLGRAPSTRRTASSGRSGARSSSSSSTAEAPYIEHDDANTNRPTPASFAARASDVVAPSVDRVRPLRS